MKWRASRRTALPAPPSPNLALTAAAGSPSIPQNKYPVAIIGHDEDISSRGISQLRTLLSPPPPRVSRCGDSPSSCRPACLSQPAHRLGGPTTPAPPRPAQHLASDKISPRHHVFARRGPAQPPFPPAAPARLSPARLRTRSMIRRQATACRRRRRQGGGGLAGNTQ